MHLLAPIGKIVLIAINYFQDENNKIKAIRELENISTVEYDNSNFELSFNSIINCINIEKEYSLVFIYATLSMIFKHLKNYELHHIFEEEYDKIKDSQIKDVKNLLTIKWLHGFMSACYSISACNIYEQKQNIELPEHIRQAVEYIEKHNYIVDVKYVM